MDIGTEEHAVGVVLSRVGVRVFVPRDPRDPRSLRDPRYWLAFALFICALLTKTVTATLPAALLLVFWWKHGRLDSRRDVQPLLPWFIVAASAGAFTAWFERAIIGAKGEDFALTLVERCLVAGRVIWFYLGKLVWPENLIFVYPRWQIDESVWWQYVFPGAAVALAVGLAILAVRHGRRGPLAGYLYFCGTLVPVLGFFDVFPFLFSYVADHFQYLASLGVIVPVAGALAMASERLGPQHRRLATALGAALIAVLGVTTWNRSGVYRDAETLYRDTIARNPGAWMAFQNLGTELAARNRLDEAIEAYEGALRARPDYAAAKNNLVLAHMKRADAAAESPDRAGEAIAHYEAVVRIDPGHFRAHYNAGTLLMDLPGRQPDALRHLESAVKIQPDNVEARVNLGVLLADVPARSREADRASGICVSEEARAREVERVSGGDKEETVETFHFLQHGGTETRRKKCNLFSEIQGFTEDSRRFGACRTMRHETTRTERHLVSDHPISNSSAPRARARASRKRLSRLSLVRAA